MPPLTSPRPPSPSPATSTSPSPASSTSSPTHPRNPPSPHPTNPQPAPPPPPPPPPPPTPPPSLPPPTTPKPYADAEINLIKVLARLADNDNPKPDSGFETLHNFILPHPNCPAGKCGRFFARELWLADPGEDAQLANFHSAIVRP